MRIVTFRPDDDGSDDDDDSNETDENIARRLNFRPIDNETIRLINRLRSLTRRRSFDRRDLDSVEFLIDELIRVQRLELFSTEQLEQLVVRLKLHRPLEGKSQALQFMHNRLRDRPTRPGTESNIHVFNTSHERQRRARLDSKDSLEEEGHDSSGHQLRDVTEINHPTPPVVLSNPSSSRSRVKQMARDIDKRSISSRQDEHVRSASPSPPNHTHRSTGSYDGESRSSVGDRLRNRLVS